MRGSKIDKYELLRQKYDWNSPIPPRNYQPGIGRGAKPFTTTAEIHIDYFSRHSSSTSAENDLMDALDNLENKRTKLRHQHSSKIESTQGLKSPPDQHGNLSPDIPLPPKRHPVLSLEDIAHLTDLKSTCILKEARDDTIPEMEEVLFSDESTVNMNDILKSQQYLKETALVRLLQSGSDDHSDTWLQRCRIFQEMGRNRKALEVLVEGCKHLAGKAEDVKAPLWHARLELLRQEPTAYRLTAEEAVLSCPHDVKLWKLIIDLHPPPSRIAYLQKAILNCPTEESFWADLTKLLPNKDEQQKVLRKALSLNPRLPLLWSRLAQLQSSHSDGSKIFRMVNENYPSPVLVIEAAVFEEIYEIELIAPKLSDLLIPTSSEVILRGLIKTYHLVNDQLIRSLNVLSSCDIHNQQEIKKEMVRLTSEDCTITLLSLIHIIGLDSLKKPLDDAHMGFFESASLCFSHVSPNVSTSNAFLYSIWKSFLISRLVLSGSTQTNLEFHLKSPKSSSDLCHVCSSTHLNHLPSFIWAVAMNLFNPLKPQESHDILGEKVLADKYSYERYFLNSSQELLTLIFVVNTVSHNATEKELIAGHDLLMLGEDWLKGNENEFYQKWELFAHRILDEKYSWTYAMLLVATIYLIPSEELIIALVEVYFSRQLIKEALYLSSFSKKYFLPQSIRIRCSIAKLLGYSKDMKMATVILKEAISEVPSNKQEDHLWLKLTLHIRSLEGHSAVKPILEEALAKFPKSVKLCLMYLQYFMHEYNKEKTQKMKWELQNVCKEMLSESHCREDPYVWSYVAHRIQSDILNSPAEARATLLMATAHFMGNFPALAILGLAKAYVELKHQGELTAFNEISSTLNLQPKKDGQFVYPVEELVSLYIDLSPLSQRPKLAQIAIQQWKVFCPLVFCSIAKIYHRSKNYEKAFREVLRALQVSGGRCGDAHGLLFYFNRNSENYVRYLCSHFGQTYDEEKEWKAFLESEIILRCNQCSPNLGPLWIYVTKEQDPTQVTIFGSKLPTEFVLTEISKMIIF